MIAMIAAIVSSTIVNVAVPDMIAAFGVGQDRAQWVATGFMVPMTLAMSLTPALLGRFGLRAAYTGAAVLLMFGGLLGGFSPSFEVMIAARVIEGLAAGVLQPIPSILILRMFAHHEQGRAAGLFSLGVVLAPAIGPTIGGLLVEGFGWRAIFFFVVPFCLASLVFAARYLPWQSSFTQAGQRIDWPGLALLTAATWMLLFGIVGMQHAGGAVRGVAWLAAGLLVAALFAWWQLRSGDPLMRVQLMRYRQFSMGSIVAFGYGVSLFGSTYLLPVFLQIALGYSPTASGLALMPGGLVLAATVPLAGRLADRRPPAELVTVGVAVIALSLALLAIVDNGSSWLTIVLLIVLGRIGLALVLPSLTLGSTRGLPRAEFAQAASQASFYRQFGGAIGVASVGVLLEWRLGVHPGDELRAFGETFLILAAICASTVVAAWRMQTSEATLPG